MSSLENGVEPLVFCEAAVKKVGELIAEEGNPDLNLRVYITGGGCSGFQYGFTFDEKVLDDDTVIVKSLHNAETRNNIAQSANNATDTRNNLAQSSNKTTEAVDIKEVKLLVDPVSMQYLEGAEIDYEEGIAGARFVFRNPNAKTTCGCGSSFAA